MKPYADIDPLRSDPALRAGAEVKPSIKDIRKKVFTELGLFGLPHRVVIKHELPVTSNGKIDRRALSRELEETKSTAQ